MGASGVQCSATICPVLPKGPIYIGGELGETAFAMGHSRVNEIVLGFGNCEKERGIDILFALRRRSWFGKSEV
jgi:hypothetical protein